jgi:hypothetical protein
MFSRISRFKSASIRSQRSGSIPLVFWRGSGGGGASSFAKYARAPGRACSGVVGGAAWNVGVASGGRGGMGDVAGDERNAAMAVSCVAESWRTRQVSWIWRRAQMRPEV